MQSFFKSKARLYTVLGVLIFQQCCCCILPIGWQVQKENPAVRQIIERVETRLADLPSLSAWLTSE
jgi:hypothetical protein